MFLKTLDIGMHETACKRQKLHSVAILKELCFFVSIEEFLKRFFIGYTLCLSLLSLLLAVVFCYALKTSTPSVLNLYNSLTIIFFLGLVTFLKDWLLKHFWIVSLVIFAFAIILRIGWVYISQTPQTSDFAFFAEIVPKIAEGEFILLPNKQTGPALVGALFHFLFGEQFLVPTLYFGALFGALSVGALWLIGYLQDQRIIAVCSSGLLAFCPEHIVFTNLLNCETYQMSSVIISLSLILLGLKWESKKKICFIAAGGLLGFGQYMRGTNLLIMIAFLVALFVFVGKRKSILLIPLSFLFLCLPILTINYTQLNIISVNPSHQSGMSFYIGTNIKSGGYYYAESGDEVSKEYEARGLEPRNLPENILPKYRLAREMAWKRIMSSPQDFLNMAIQSKLPTYWSTPATFEWSIRGSQVEKYISSINTAGSLFHQFLLFFCMIGFLFGAVRQQQNSLMMSVCILCVSGFTLLHMIVEVQQRYHQILLPFVAFVSAYGISVLVDFFKAQGLLAIAFKRV